MGTQVKTDYDSDGRSTLKDGDSPSNDILLEPVKPVFKIKKKK